LKGRFYLGFIRFFYANDTCSFLKMILPVNAFS